MHCLHVLDALDERGPVRALLHLLRLAALESALDETLAVHDVLAMAGGALEAEIRAYARRVTIAATGLEITAAVLTRDYDIVHALEARSARRLAPLITSAASAAFIYSGPALAGRTRPLTTGHEPAHRALLAASDLVVMAPESCASPALGASLVHRSVCLDLARLAEPQPTDPGHLRPIDIDAPELHFIVREWAAAIGGVGRLPAAEPDPETLHP
jgi:hypothetical protein